MRRFAACLLVCLPLLALADWPQFRGPTGQGTAQSGPLPAEWSTTKNVVWKQDVPGAGWSSPVVVDGSVYLTSAVEIKGSNDRSLRVLRLNAKDGKILWNVE